MTARPRTLTQVEATKLLGFLHTETTEQWERRIVGPVWVPPPKQPEQPEKDRRK